MSLEAERGATFSDKMNVILKISFSNFQHSNNKR